MFKLEKGDIIKTINGKVLRVTRTSENYVYGEDITDDVYFMCMYSRKELDNLIKEVYYV